MTCPLCDKSVKVNETDPVAHTYETTYTINDEYHWFKCVNCGDANGKEFHTLDDEGSCTICQLPVSSTPGVVYEVSADGTYAEVIGYGGTATKVKIASEYNGVPVTKIYYNAFVNNKTITNVVIGDSVTSIGDYAFYYCTSLTSVVIGDSVTSIGSYAFSYCSSLTSVVIPDSVTSIGDYAFYYCFSLTTVKMCNSLTNIGDGAFWSTFLTSIVIPDSVTIIGTYAFHSCVDLTSVVIGNGVTNIGYMAFNNSYKLTNIAFNGNIEQWNSIAKGTKWNERVPATEVICSDGTVTLK